MNDTCKYDSVWLGLFLPGWVKVTYLPEQRGFCCSPCPPVEDCPAPPCPCPRGPSSGCKAALPPWETHSLQESHRPHLADRKRTGIRTTPRFYCPKTRTGVCQIYRLRYIIYCCLRSWWRRQDARLVGILGEDLWSIERQKVSSLRPQNITITLSLDL